MTVVRWTPIRGMVNLQDEINRLFNDFLTGTPDEEAGRSGHWQPPVDISETDNEILVIAEVPGLEKDDIKLVIQENVLTLEGEKKANSEPDEKSYHREERSYGVFKRSFSLPTAVQSEKVKATYKNGVLFIRLPKAEEAKPKQVAISVK